MNDVYVMGSILLFIGTCYAQWKICKIGKDYQYILPILYLLLTFFIGLVALLMSFVLIFIAQFTNIKVD